MLAFVAVMTSCALVVFAIAVLALSLRGQGARIIDALAGMPASPPLAPLPPRARPAARVKSPAFRPQRLPLAAAA